MATTISGTSITFNDATTQTTTGTEFVTGTLMLFQQTAAPTGWTKQTTHHDKALRVVTGSVVNGGNVAFSIAYANTTPTITTSSLSAAATTLTTTQMPSHTHDVGYSDGSGYGGGVGGVQQGGCFQNNSAHFSGAAGSGGSHTHSVSGSATSSVIPLNVQYVDLIIASKS
jgi:hypothetical protein